MAVLRATSALIAVAAVMVGVWLWSSGSPAEPQTRTGGVEGAASAKDARESRSTGGQPPGADGATVGSNDGAEAAGTPAGPALKGPHVTFGTHTSATLACVKCHPKSPKPGALVCRDCHGFSCGKDAKTVADCLKCHKTGSTKEWVR